MYVECTHCHALYRITPIQLEAGEGWVRCGECGQVFEASETLSDPEEQAPNFGIDESLDEDTFRDIIDPAEAEIPSAPPEHAPPKSAHRRSGTVLWSLLILALIALLGAQYLLSQRDELARYGALRPLLTQLCRLRGCALPPRRNLSDIELASRNVFTHPNIPHALMITATLVNNAPFPQPYPVMEVSFSNLDGKLVALGRFTPRQYLPKSISPASLMPVGKPIHVSLSVNDPGQQALAYEFSFH